VRVSMIAPDPTAETTMRHLVAQARVFGERGDEVRLVLDTPPAALPDDVASRVVSAAGPLPPAELYIYHCVDDSPLLASLRQRDTGTILIHDHGAGQTLYPPARETEGGRWLPAHFADLCLVDDAARRDALVHDYGLPPERVCLLPGVDQEAAYRAALVELVDQALADDWPPVSLSGKPLDLPTSEIETVPNRAALKGGLELARSQADVMQRDYVVRSQIPLLGGLLAWVRRNLTSHLREPYLDPTLERQVAFNRTVIGWMEQAQARLDALETQLQRLQNQAPVAGEDKTNEQVSDGG